MGIEDPDATLSSPPRAEPATSHSYASPSDGIIAGRYRIDKKLGEGGYGAVYRATHLQMGSHVALKLLHHTHSHEAETVRRFELEARRSAQLQHPHCIRVFDFGACDDNGWFIAMEFLEGRTLASALQTDGWLPVPRALRILDQTLAALEAAHDLGLVHRDLKPENIFLTRVAKDPDFVKVLDFGIAKAMQSNIDAPSITASGVVIGTPTYMSPEQCRGDLVDPRSDLYSLGCVAFTLLSGAPPFKRDTLVGYLLAHVQQPPPDLAAVSSQAIPEWLVAWVARCLEKEPSRRFASAEEARAELALQRSQLVTGPHSSQLPALPYDTVDRLPSPRKTNPRLWLGLGALAVGVAIAVGLMLAEPSTSPATTLEHIAVVSPSQPVVDTPTPSTPAPTSTDNAPGSPAPTPNPATQALAATSETPTPEPDMAPPTRPPTNEPTEPLPNPTPMVIHLESTPAGARVTHNGTLLGTTPVDITWPANTPPPDLHLEAPGHVRQPVSLTRLTSGETHNVTLTRTRQPSRTSTAPVTPAATSPKPTTKPTPTTARPPSDFIRIEDSP